ncbi:hypothetical protein BASA81_002980 [Batrachochytrium salamandrivorans]|nr:hypothetical protein BASA81_007592 [Batrachochytrium salamandrivorans]KAH9258485.1 hypothetical protein BASA81_002980 [Batrachochytrium salamandrivorans]
MGTSRFTTAFQRARIHECRSQCSENRRTAVFETFSAASSILLLPKAAELQAALHPIAVAASFNPRSVPKQPSVG